MIVDRRLVFGQIDGLDNPGSLWTTFYYLDVIAAG
jgi:hypothetical protein